MAERGPEVDPAHAAAAPTGVIPSGSGDPFSWMLPYVLSRTSRQNQKPMNTVAILARLEAKAGKEAELEAFLKSALPLAQAEPGTTFWFALKIGPSTFGIFDTFRDEAGRKAHLDGPIAAALMAKAGELLAQPPTLEMVELLAEKA